MREFGGMSNSPRATFLAVLLSVGSMVSGQVPPPAIPAQVVMIFKVEPKEFKSLTLDKKPFASLEVAMEYSTMWPVPPGKHELAVAAPGAEEKKLDFTVNTKDVGLLFVDLVPNPDSAKAAQNPKAISMVWLPIDLPEPDQKSAKVFVYLTPEMKPTSGELLHGNTNPTTVNLTPGKLNPLGEGKTGLSVGGDLLYLVNPGAPGIYVGVILPLNDGKLRSVPFSFELAEPEPEPKGKPKGPPADY
ncbi:MAG: hypothetical protein EBU36_06580 [Verrucomicrobia bacterium]|nr:hypothetical protein [Verrucomicrobiota bacterium]